MLESYRSKKAEIQELQHKIAHLHEGDSMIGNSTIFDYRNGYPMPQTIVGVDWDKFDKTKTKYNNCIKSLEGECEEVEEFVENIPDSLTRRIFRMHYQDGIAQKNIAQILHMEKSNISKKIANYLKLSTNSTKSTL